jgi:hypothetical protein
MDITDKPERTSLKTISHLRLYLSATIPATGESKALGKKELTIEAPVARVDPVNSYMNQAMAKSCKAVPMAEMSCPDHSSTKFRFVSSRLILSPPLNLLTLTLLVAFQQSKAKFPS